MQHLLSTKRFLLMLLAVPLMVGWTGCATTASPEEQLNKNLVVAQQLNTSIVTTIGTLAETGRISKQDATQALKVVDVAQEGIVVVNILRVNDIAAANTRIVGIVASLMELNKYLLTRKEGSTK